MPTEDQTIPTGGWNSTGWSGSQDELPEGDPGFPQHWIPGAAGVAADLARMSDADMLATINAALAARKGGR
mgnify:CR=1 FL=1|jgi:hypothetical protein